ncbi:MAG TPA: BtrH N-terminal domain-containing protein, partial [Actinomycetes bacterium]|nr:BtrH N-terminal domain-containing protein [Actinomycetes bacterium]
MPTDKDFKRLVRARMGKTGESYTTARSHLRPDQGPDRPGRLRGRHPDTAALARLLAALGVTDPATGRPLSEATVLGVSGGIGFAYFVFEYEEGATLYLGGRINSYVQKQDAAEAALTRLGVPFQAHRTSGPATAERQLRAALDQGRPVVATVDVARLRYRAVPDWLCGMTPQDVLVELADGEPLLWDLAPAPFPVTWAELAEARAGVRSAKHRLLVAEPPEEPVDLAGAAAAGIADTWKGMLEPPMRNFGAPGLAKWADLLTDTRDPKGW